jgi:tetratricopeptide (TPR) repeat protein
LHVKEEFEMALRRAVGVDWFWTTRGHFHEARDVFEALIAMPAAEETPAALAMALNCCGDAAHWLGDIERAQVLFEWALLIYREIDDRHDVAMTLRGLGSLAIAANQARAPDLTAGALVVAHEVGADWYAAGAKHLLGIVAFATGDYDRAITLQEQALVDRRRQGDVGYVAAALTQLRLLRQQQLRQRCLRARVRGPVPRVGRVREWRLLLRRLRQHGQQCRYVRVQLPCLVGFDCVNGQCRRQGGDGEPTRTRRITAKRRGKSEYPSKQT